MLIFFEVVVFFVTPLLTRCLIFSILILIDAGVFILIDLNPGVLILTGRFLVIV